MIHNEAGEIRLVEVNREGSEEHTRNCRERIDPTELFDSGTS
jgi:hypothetical protein